MNEKMPSTPPPAPEGTPEKKEEVHDEAYWDARAAESAKWIEYWKQEEVKKQQAIAAENPMKEGDPRIAEFEKMVTDFELKHSLEALHAITHLNPKDTASKPERESAKEALIPISDRLNELRDRLGKTSEAFIAAKTKYIRLSQAVGMISGFPPYEVDHTRTF